MDAESSVAAESSVDAESSMEAESSGVAGSSMEAESSGVAGSSGVLGSSRSRSSVWLPTPEPPGSFELDVAGPAEPPPPCPDGGWPLLPPTVVELEVPLAVAPLPALPDALTPGETVSAPNELSHGEVQLSAPAVSESAGSAVHAPQALTMKTATHP